MIRATVTSFLLSVASTLPMVAEPLRLGAGDVVSVSVLNREDVSGRFRVGEDGTISLHILGRVQATGRTVAEVETTIEDAISARTDLPASVTAEIVEWRPVYVLGDVERQGEIAFRPGLTVQRAVAMAGGLFPRIGGDVSGLDIRLADERNALGKLHQDLNSVLIKRARLEAELSGTSDLKLPEEILTLPDAGAALANEQRAILLQQTESTKASIGSTEKQIALAEREADSLENQQALLSKQIAEDEKTLTNLRDLLEKGLTNSERVRQLERGLNEDKMQLMLASTYEARSRQDKVIAEASIVAIKSKRQSDIAQELAQLADAERGIRTQISATEAFLVQFGGAIASNPGATALVPPVYRIVRASPGQSDVEIPAAPHAPVLPGDLIEVKRGGWDTP